MKALDISEIFSTPLEIFVSGVFQCVSSSNQIVFLGQHQKLFISRGLSILQRSVVNCESFDVRYIIWNFSIKFNLGNTRSHVSGSKKLRMIINLELFKQNESVMVHHESSKNIYAETVNDKLIFLRSTLHNLFICNFISNSFYVLSVFKLTIFYDS